MNTADLDTLMVVIRFGSFAAAARELNVDPSSVSRTVAALEDELGTRLFQRNTRQLAVTEAGAVLAQRLGPLLEELQEIRNAATDSANRVHGTLRVTVSNAFGLRRIVPLLPSFCREHPALDVDLILSDDIVDLVAERIDVAVRLGALHDSSLVAVPLLKTHYRVVASPVWLAQRGAPPATPFELKDCDCLTFSMPGFRERWLFRPRDGGAHFAVNVKPRVLMTNGLALREVTLGGLGPSLLPDWLVSTDLEAGRLVDLFPQHDVAAVDAPTGAWLVYPSRSYVPAKVRAFIDFVRRSIHEPSNDNTWP